MRRFLTRALVYVSVAVVVIHAAVAMSLLALRFINPWTTGVQMQRRVESWIPGPRGKTRVKTRSVTYQKQQVFVPLERISLNLQHAVISAEDGRFYQHDGVDWDELEKVMEDAADAGELPRGASTITQQLVKNLYFTTHRNPVRKAFEYSFALMADRILGKRRSLELYLNIVEWGPGIWGAQAAAKYHYGTNAAHLNREQASRLAACLPNPRRRRPAFMTRYSGIIEDRMARAGW